MECKEKCVECKEKCVEKVKIEFWRKETRMLLLRNAILEELIKIYKEG